MTVLTVIGLVGLEAVLDLLGGALVVFFLLLLLIDLVVRDLERDLKLYLRWEIILI